MLGGGREGMGVEKGGSSGPLSRAGHAGCRVWVWVAVQGEGVGNGEGMGMGGGADRAGWPG